MSQTRRNNLRNIGTILALVISIIAMVTSIYEANILRAQQKSMVWPYLSVSLNYNAEGFSASVYNNGTGPAIVNSMEVRANGQPVADMLELVNVLLPESDLGYDFLSQGKVNKYVFRPGEEVEIIGFRWTEETRQLARLINNNVTLKLSYQSVLGDSWVYDSKKDTHEKGSYKPEIEYVN